LEPARGGSSVAIVNNLYGTAASRVFVNGTLSANHPQFLARGEGPKVGVLRFFLKNRWDLAAGQYGQRLLFNLSSP
jgi:hypothetical protein